MTNESHYRLQEEVGPPNIMNERPIAYRRLARAALLAAILAAVANAVVLTIEKNVFKLPMLVTTVPGTNLTPLSYLMVIEVSAAVAIAAALLLIFLARFVAHPIRWFQIIALVILVLSLAGPLSIPVDMATRMALGAMHLVAALVIVWVLTTQTQVGTVAQ